MAYGVLVHAVYEDGFELLEDEADQSPYDEGRNIFHAIVNSLPVPEHGPMVVWELITVKDTYTLDWAEICSSFINPRIIYFRNMNRDFNSETGEPINDATCSGHVFGFQYNDADGANQKATVEITI